MRKTHISIIIIALCLFGCTTMKDESLDAPKFSETFIRVYCFVNSNTTSWSYVSSENAVKIILKGEDIWGKAYDGLPPMAQFNTLARYFGDTNYYDYIPKIPGMNNAIADEFLSIDIVSNLDFGPGYPAGASLKEMAEFYGTSAYPYIKSGYDFSLLLREGDWIDLIDYESGYTPVIKLLSELTPEDMTLLGRVVHIKFTDPPPPGNHTFTITMVTKDRTITKSLDVEIE